MLVAPKSRNKTRLSPTGLILHALSEGNGRELQSPVALKKYLITSDGPLDFTFGIRTENGSVLSGIVFRKGVVSIMRACPITPMR